MSEQTPPPPNDGGDLTPPPPPPPAGDQGGFAPPPPPPPPGGGFTPPPPPPAPPAGAPGPYSAPDAIGYGWTKFWKKPGDLLVPILIVAIIFVVWAVVVSIILASIFGNSFGAQLISAAFSSLLVGVVLNALIAGLVKASLNFVDGRPVALGDVFTVATRSDVLTTAVILAAASFVGTLACYVGAILVSFFTWFTYYFLLDKGLAPIDAIKASVSFTGSHIGEIIVLAILGALVLFAGGILCLVGLLVAWPVVLIAGAYTFRRLHGEPVAPPV